MNTPGTRQSPGLVRIIGAIALAIVLAVGSSAAIAGFLTDWGRHGNPDSRRRPSQVRPRPAAPLPRRARRSHEHAKPLRHCRRSPPPRTRCDTARFSILRTGRRPVDEGDRPRWPMLTDGSSTS
jgi:hypothetical protein